MKRWIAVLLVLLLAGCGAEVLTTTAIQGELQKQQLTAMDKQLKHASDMAAKTKLRHAIDTYYAEKGYYPLTLDSLAPEYIPTIPKKPDGTEYGYNPSTGKLSDSTAPEKGQTAQQQSARASGNPVSQGPGETNQRKIARIRAAIHKYGTQTGYYPPTLSALVPQYLPALPKTNDGKDFGYNNQNGRLWVPGQGPATGQARRQQNQQAHQRRGRGTTHRGGGTGGPMGEVMTGIGVQQELNSMGSPGANAAGGYGRRSISGTTQRHNQRQQQVMDDLGL